MPPAENTQADKTLAEYLSVVRRYAWIILIMVVVAPTTAYLVSSQRPEVFSASSDVLLSRQDLGSALTGVPSATAYADPDRLSRTQAALARTPDVARRAIEGAGITGMFPYELLSSSTVSPQENADLLRFTVLDGTPSVASRLANAYAEAFTEYKLEMDTTSLALAGDELEDRLAELRDEGATDTQVYRDLVGQAQSLRTIELLQARASVVREATSANKVAPSPKRNALLGGLLGILLGLGFAFLWNALDRRVRTQGEVERMLGIPLLARLPRPGRQLRRPDRLAMLDEPAEASAEAVRRLRTNLELANLDGNAKVIMVTSASPGEGKSTTIANLAVALARSGRSVALVELDLRRPALASFFRLGSRAGVTDVILGRIKLRDALVPVPLSALGPKAQNGAGPHATGERLFILPSGTLPANPGEFVGTQSVARLLEELRRDHDFVLVDAPPLLSVVDAMTLSTRVDAVFAVVRLGVANRPMLEDLGRGLDSSPATKLGFVLTGTDDRKVYGTSAYAYHARGVDIPQAPTPLPRATSSRR